MSNLLDLKLICKSYGAVQVLSGVNLSIDAGDVLAICGDNGAGKSTLIKIISGAEPATSGQVFLFGEKVHFASPADALARGVATICQMFWLLPIGLRYLKMELKSVNA